MIKSMNFSSIKKRQHYLLWGVGSFLMGGIIVYGWVALREAPLKQKHELKSSIATGSGRTNPQENWVYQFTQEADLTKKRLDAMQETLQRILKINETKRDEAQKPFAQNASDATSIESLRKDIKSQLKESQPTEPQIRAESRDSQNIKFDKNLPPPPGNPQIIETQKYEHGNSASSNPFHSKTVRKISLSLKNTRNNVPLKTVDNTVPAGAFARSILLGGVDASASIQASSDPRPALLRITDPGTLPRKFHSDLKGCHALAACYGDISSERVFMRLEKLTCTERKTGEIIEVKVQGYVAGEDGRTGIRGTVVDRAGESMRNAMMGGFLGGIGEFLSQSHNAVTFSPMTGLAQSAPMGVGEMLKHGAGKGMNNALEKYADFYIKRAEQVQPVIQVAAGRQVDIVFTEGVSLNDTLYRQALGRSHDQGRYQQIQTITEETPQSPISDWVGNSNSK